MEGERDPFIEQLRITSEVADARLGVAEEFAWPLGGLVAVSAYLAGMHWGFAVPLSFAVYYFATLTYRRQAGAAEDRYHREAGVGKYFCPPNEN